MARKAAPTPGTTLKQNLIYLAAAGVTQDSVLKCHHLATAIFGEDSLTLLTLPETRVALSQKVSDVLSNVAQISQAYVFENREHVFGGEIGSKLQAAAVGELMGFMSTNEHFEDVRRAGKRDDDAEWITTCSTKGYRERGSARMRQLRAGVWIGGQSDRTVRNLLVQLIDSFEAAINDYLDTDNRRAELRSAMAHLEQPRLATDTTASNAQAPSDHAALAALPSPRPRSGSLLSPSPPSDPELKKWFEQLASEAHRQLRDEDGKDKATDPIPLSVRWSIAKLRPSDQAVNVWGGDDAPPSVTTGTFNTVTDLFESVPSRRLVILGKGGAGKTTLARKLALELLERQPNGPVPVIFRLASWDLTTKVSLRDWMTTQLIEDGLGGLEAIIRDVRGTRITVGTALVRGRHILPILDGLDEIAPSHRATALRWINEGLGHDHHLVLTSRPHEYVEAVEASDVIVERAAVIELHDVTPNDLAAYLPRKGREATQTKWDPILQQLREPSMAGAPALREVLTTPLMASLARVIYSATAADPAELLDVERFPNAGAITGHLLNAFVQTRYSDQPQDRIGRKRPQWQPEDARRWLGFVALMMSTQKTYRYAWWRPRQYRMMRLFHWHALVIEIVAATLALGFGFLEVLLHPDGVMRPVLAIGTAGCFALGLTIFLGSSANPRRLHKPEMPQKYPGLTLRTAWRAQPVRECFLLVANMVSAFYICFATKPYLAAAFGTPRSRGGNPNHLLAAQAVALLVSLTIVGFMAVVTPGGINTRSPRQLLHDDRRATVATGLYYGATASIICGSFWIYAGRPVWLLTIPVIFVFAILNAFCLGAYGQWFIRYSGFSVPGVQWLPRPSQAMSFLDDACTRGILRQVGSVYEFRHALLQERLAIGFLESRPAWIQEHRTILYARSQLVVSRLNTGEDSNVIESELRELIEKQRRYKNKHGVMWTWERLIYTLRRDGRRDDALNEAISFRHYMDGIRTRQAYQNWHYKSRRILADLLCELDRFGEAVSEYEDVLRLAEGFWGEDDEDVAETRGIIAELNDQLVNRAEDSQLARRANERE